VKAIKSHELKEGDLYYDVNYIDNVLSTILRFEREEDGKLLFSHYYGQKCYLELNGFILFSVNHIFYKP